MKNILKILSIAVFICVSMNVEGISKKEERVKKIQDLYFDTLAYTSGTVSPNNGHFPHMRRIVNWHLEVFQYSDEEKRELIPDIETINTQFTERMFNRKDITARQAYDFNAAILAIYCPLVSQELCDKLNDSNTEKCDAILAAEQAAREVQKKLVSE